MLKSSVSSETSFEYMVALSAEMGNQSQQPCRRLSRRKNSISGRKMRSSISSDTSRSSTLHGIPATCNQRQHLKRPQVFKHLDPLQLPYPNLYLELPIFPVNSNIP